MLIASEYADLSGSQNGRKGSVAVKQKTQDAIGFE
jgi:hypothetical protein